MIQGEVPELPPENLRELTPNHNPYHHYVTVDGRLTSEGIAQVAFGINTFAHACHINAREHGWWDSHGRNFGEMIALMHSELSEALEAYRDGDDIQKIYYGPYKGNSPVSNEEVPKPLGIASEFADVIIRVLDTCAALGIPIGEALIQKHAYNHTRPHKHGGKLC